MANKAARVQRITIPSGGSISNEVVDLTGIEAFTIIIPAAWTAAALTFAILSELTAAPVPAYDEGGNELTVLAANVAASRAICLTTLALQEMTTSCPWLKVRSGTNVAPVNQAADRLLTVLLGG